MKHFNYLFLTFLLIACSVSVNAFIDYQEVANYSYWNGYGCGITYPCSNFNDSNFNTRARNELTGGTGWTYFYENYTVNVSGNVVNHILKFRDQLGTFNISIPASCKRTSVDIRISHIAWSGCCTCHSDWYCYNGSDYQLLQSDTAFDSSTCYVYENGLYTNYTLPANLTLDLSGYVANCSESHGLPVVLKMNNSPVVNPYDPGSSPGYYSFNCSAVGDENYTANYTTGSFTIFPVVYNVTVYLNGSDMNMSGTFPYPINFTCETNDSTELSLYLNNTPLVNATVSDLAAGYWNFSCNNSVVQKSLFLTINKASSITRLFLNGTESDTTLSWPNSINASATADYGSVVLYRNSTNLSNPEVLVLAPGSYHYEASTAESENHTYSTVSYTLTVSKAFGIIEILLNGHVGDLSILVGELSNATARVDAGSVNLYRDGVLKANPDIDVLGRGFYVYFANSSGDENHSASSTLYTLNVHLSDNANDEFIGAFAMLGIGLIIAAHYFKTKLKK